MNIIFFTHPSFTYSQSMPRYTNWVMEGMRERGHTVRLLKPKPYFFKLPFPASIKKWLGYIDQFIIFPAKVRRILAKENGDTLWVITDHALGPWVPLVKERCHVIHCHDFLAQRSALGQIAEVKTSTTGRIYQSYIRKGYQEGENFISVSEQTQKELLELLGTAPASSVVVYNGLTQVFTPADDMQQSRNELTKETGIDLTGGYLLHVGGNQWYKNREGVIQIYNSWRKSSAEGIPLLMIGEEPTPELNELYSLSAFKADIYFLTGKNDNFVKRSYAAASLFIFPSLAEGFGWPIIEAMASGCPVVTTREAPMTEVGGDAAIYIERRPADKEKWPQWADNVAKDLNDFFANEEANRKRFTDLGKTNVLRFDPRKAMDRIEAVYENIVSRKTVANDNKTHFS